jgi:hypothetical protein
VLTPKIPRYVQQQKEAEAKGKEAEYRSDRKKIVLALEGLLEYVKTDNNQRQPNEQLKWLMAWSLQQKQYRVTLAYTIVTAFGVAAAFIAGIFAFKQLHVMRGQLEVTISQLSPKLEMTLKGPQQPATRTIGSVKQLGWLITPNWENHGSTDADDFRGWDDSKFFSPDAPSAYDFLTPESSKAPGITVGPGETRLQTSQFVTQDDVRSVIGGSGKIVIWGYIEYRDSLPEGRSHKIHWCYLVTPVDAVGYILFPKQTHPESIHWRGDQPQSGQWIYVIGCVAYIDQFRDWHWTRFCVLTGSGVIPLTGSQQTLCTLYNDTDETDRKHK